jgi:hypothetical protein
MKWHTRLKAVPSKSAPKSQGNKLTGKDWGSAVAGIFLLVRREYSATSLTR